jgi:hypothetical protein
MSGQAITEKLLGHLRKNPLYDDPLPSDLPNSDSAKQAGGRGDDPSTVAAYRQKTVSALNHSWAGYKRYAWGCDEFYPLRRGGGNWSRSVGAVGVTMADALDTLMLAGFTTEVDEVIDVLGSIDYSQLNLEVSVFETTIRVLGGLLSGAQLAKNSKQRATLLAQAEQLADRLMPAFSTGSSRWAPHNYVHLKIGSHHHGGRWAVLSQVGSSFVPSAT